MAESTSTGVGGYTIVELIAVMVIISIIAVAIVLNLPSSAYKDKIDVEELITNTRYVQEKAMSEGIACCLHFRTREYYFTCANTSLEFANGESMVSVNSNITVKCGSNAVDKVCFDYTGSPVCSKTVVIQLGSEALKIYPSTGGVFEE